MSHYDFCMFPTALLSDPRYRALGGRDRDVLMAMVRWARTVDSRLTVCESYESIARMVAMDRRNVVRSVKKMVGAGLLALVAEGRGVRPNTYVVDVPEGDPEAVRAARYVPAVVAPEQVSWEPQCDWMGSDWEPVPDAEWGGRPSAEDPAPCPDADTAAEPSVITGDTPGGVVTGDNTSPSGPPSGVVTCDYASGVTHDTPFRRGKTPPRESYLSWKSVGEGPGPRDPPGRAEGTAGTDGFDDERGTDGDAGDGGREAGGRDGAGDGGGLDAARRRHRDGGGLLPDVAARVG